MNRILIIGRCGAGKSTLAFRLGEKLSLSVYHMDQLNWRTGWIESSQNEIEARLSRIVAGDKWIIDGNYGGTLAPRLERADTVLYLDYPIHLCVTRLFKRLWMYRGGRTRPDMTEGCPERFDLEFLFYLLRWNSGPRIRTEQRLKGHESKIVRLKSPDALQIWLKEKVK